MLEKSATSASEQLEALDFALTPVTRCSHLPAYGVVPGLVTHFLVQHLLAAALVLLPRSKTLGVEVNTQSADFFTRISTVHHAYHHVEESDGVSDARIAHAQTYTQREN